MNRNKHSPVAILVSAGRTALYAGCLLLLATLVQAQFKTVKTPLHGSASLRICMTCHGAYGQGNSSVGGPKLAGMEPWYLRRQLQAFRQGLRGTQPDYIPGYEMRESVAFYSDVEIEDIISQVAGWPDGSPVQTTVTGNPERGSGLYQGCIACHGPQAGGNEALGAPALAGRSDWYLLRQLKLYKSGYRGGHPDDTAGAQMRLMVQGMAANPDLADVVAYINTLDNP